MSGARRRAGRGDRNRCVAPGAQADGATSVLLRTVAAVEVCRALHHGSASGQVLRVLWNEPHRLDGHPNAVSVRSHGSDPARLRPGRRPRRARVGGGDGRVAEAMKFPGELSDASSAPPRPRRAWYPERLRARMGEIARGTPSLALGGDFTTMGFAGGDRAPTETPSRRRARPSGDRCDLHDARVGLV